MTSLFATGLGLLVSSRGSVEALGARADDPEIASMIQNQAIVLLQTGSPELDYNISVRLTNAPMNRQAGSHATSVRFGLIVRGGALSVADGSELDELGRGTRFIHFPVPDGYYAVDAIWVPSPHHRHMNIIFALCPTTDTVPLIEPVELFYVNPDLRP